MPIGQEQLTKIITISKNYPQDGDLDELNKILWTEGLLPKVMMPEVPESVHEDYEIFTSKKSMEFAKEHYLHPSGSGTGKDGKFTVADLKLFLSVKTKAEKEKVKKPKEFRIYPKAEDLAKSKRLTKEELEKIEPSGRHGHILLKDIEKFVKEKKAKKAKAKEEAETSGSSSSESSESSESE